MEGIRRIGVVIKAVAIIWLLGFLVGAAFNAVGSDVPMSQEQIQEIYERETGKSLRAEAESQTAGQPASSSAFDKWIGSADASGHILNQYFAHRSTMTRKRDWGNATLCLILGVVGAAILGALGWIVAGFAGQKQRQ
jgi:hypothetical protein